jgi:hypothetical protein
MADIENTIIDSSKPNAGRIYDYLIGGHHHFPVDREMADKLVKSTPILPEFLKWVRWFLHEAIYKAKEWGFTQFIDFASGLPVEDHIHNNTPAGTKVIYSDIDPVTVKIGRNLIGANPIVKYEVCDAGTPEKLLESAVVKNLFKDNHKAAIGFTGICWFLKDEQIAHAMKTLYDWADNESIVYISDAETTKLTIDPKHIDAYKDMKAPFSLRTKAKLLELIKPWKVKEPGFLPLEKWHDLAPTITIEVQTTHGIEPFGGFLEK